MPAFGDLIEVQAAQMLDCLIDLGAHGGSRRLFEGGERLIAQQSQPVDFGHFRDELRIGPDAMRAFTEAVGVGLSALVLHHDRRGRRHGHRLRVRPLKIVDEARCRRFPFAMIDGVAEEAPAQIAVFVPIAERHAEIEVAGVAGIDCRAQTHRIERVFDQAVVIAVRQTLGKAHEGAVVAIGAFFAIGDVNRMLAALGDLGGVFAVFAGGRLAHLLLQPWGNRGIGSTVRPKR